MKYTHIGRLFYFDADIPSDVTEMKMEAGGHEATAKKLFWRFWWLV